MKSIIIGCCAVIGTENLTTFSRSSGRVKGQALRQFVVMPSLFCSCVFCIPGSGTGVERSFDPGFRRWLRDPVWSDVARPQTALESGEVLEWSSGVHWCGFADDGMDLLGRDTPIRKQQSLLFPLAWPWP